MNCVQCTLKALRPVYTGDFCCNFSCVFFAAISSEISNHPCKLLAIQIATITSGLQLCWNCCRNCDTNRQCKRAKSTDKLQEFELKLLESFIQASVRLISPSIDQEGEMARLLVLNERWLSWDNLLNCFICRHITNSSTYKIKVKLVWFLFIFVFCIKSILEYWGSAK